MSRLRPLAVLLIALFVLGLHPASALAAADTAAPTVQAVTRTSASELALGDALTLQIDATDSDSGLAGYEARYVGPTGAWYYLSWAPGGAMTSTVGEHWPDGTYMLEYVLARDVAQNSATYYAGGYVMNNPSGASGPTTHVLDLGAASFTVGPNTAPSAPKSPWASAGDTTATVSWSAPTYNGGARISGYTATAGPDGPSCTTTGELSCALTGLANGTSYSFTVSATNSVGTSAPSEASAPVTPRGKPGPARNVVATPSRAAAIVSWDPPVSDGGAPVQGYTVVASPGTQTCAALGGLSCTVSGLSNIPYTFTVHAATGIGFSASAPSAPVTPFPWDTRAPRVTPNGVPTFSVASAVAFSFSATDDSGSVASYDVRYRRAAYNGAFGTLTYPTAWQRTTARSVRLTAIKGTTFCFSVRARDNTGNTAPWSAEQCTGVALDDRGLTASAGWTRPTGAVYYAGTVAASQKAGAAVTRTGVQARRIAVVVTRCSTCGTIGVYWNGRLLRQISLASRTTLHRQVMHVADLGAVRTGTLTIRAVDSHRVFVDGIAVRRV